MSDPDKPSKSPRSSAPAGVSSAPKAALDALLNGASADPLRRAMWLDALDRQLRSCLPPSLALHARLANVDGHRLVYLVDSPVWHAKVRLASAQLLDAARSIGLDVAYVTVRTATRPFQPPAAAATPAKPMSDTARDTLRSVLESLRPTREGGPDGNRS